MVREKLEVDIYGTSYKIRCRFKRVGEILSKAKEEAAQLLANSNARIENTIREIRESQADKERTKQARETLADFKINVVEEEDNVLI